MYFLSHTRRTAIINENKSFGRFCVQNSKMALHARYVSKGLDIKLQLFKFDIENAWLQGNL